MKPSELLRATRDWNIKGISGKFIERDEDGEVCGLCAAGAIMIKAGINPLLIEMAQESYFSDAAKELDEKIAEKVPELRQKMSLEHLDPELRMKLTRRDKYKMSEVIAFLNDDLSWGWKQIADFLEKSGY